MLGARVVAGALLRALPLLTWVFTNFARAPLDALLCAMLGVFVLMFLFANLVAMLDFLCILTHVVALLRFFVL